MPYTAPHLRIGDESTYARVLDWRLKGSNEEIGAALGARGANALQAVPLAASDPGRIREQQRFFRRHFRPFYDRMEGIADAHGLLMEECSHDLATLWFDIQWPGCSAASVPRNRMANGRGHVLRNMDLGVDLSGKTDHPPSSRIFMMELAPSEGLASLSAVVFDLMSAMDGINEKGLVVVCNSHGDYRLNTGYACEPVTHPEPGLNELQIVRYLLDMCSDTDDAREAFLSLRTYYCFTPCIYMVADARGRAVVVEKSRSGNRINFTEADGEPLIMTNFGRARFSRGADMPEDDGPKQGFVYTRYRLIEQGIDAQEMHDMESLDAIARRASFDHLSEAHHSDDSPLDRTIYRTIYDVDARAVQVSCYLGEGEDGPMHSDPLMLSLGESDADQ